jgi:hypothetical protein
MAGPDGFTFESGYRGELPSLGVGPKRPCTDSHRPDQRQTAIGDHQETNMRSATEHSTLGDGHEVLYLICIQLPATAETQL